jgi:hypothetical protein
MTIGTVYILLGIVKAFIDIIEKCIVAAGVILLLLSFAYGIHDRFRRKGKMPVKIATTIKEVDLTNIKVPAIVIYDHPSDYPKHYVARVFDGDRPTDTIILKDTLKELQEDIKANTDMVFILRGAEDAPCIEGAWL